MILSEIYDTLADNGWKCTTSEPDTPLYIPKVFVKEHFYIVVTVFMLADMGIRLVMYDGDISTKTAYLLATASNENVPDSLKLYKENKEIPFEKFISLISKDISQIPIAAGNYVTEKLLETL